jgi:hypothetical protein
VIIQWIPGHSNIPGNDWLISVLIRVEDRLYHHSHTYNTARVIIRRGIKDPPSKHPTVSKAYEHLSSKEEGKIQLRKEAALLAQ